ncbi:MAG: Gfo/Idh/MocA family oxidoreductase, partial [Tidjanibacter sp.]|nr:Gfo/Idh/MocA family oxidoreductase [Tidjanibacter sp.]
MISRKDFLKQTLAGAAALSFGGGTAWANSSLGRVAGANERIRIGVIGVNSRGRAIANELSKLSAECEVTHVCDVDTRAIERCQQSVKSITGKAPKGERDLRVLLQNPDIDAVVIAMPDHWHAPAAIMAMQAGKHVYLEK